MANVREAAPFTPDYSTQGNQQHVNAIGESNSRAFRVVKDECVIVNVFESYPEIPVYRDTEETLELIKRIKDTCHSLTLQEPATLEKLAKKLEAINREGVNALQIVPTHESPRVLPAQDSPRVAPAHDSSGESPLLTPTGADTPIPRYLSEQRSETNSSGSSPLSTVSSIYVASKGKNASTQEKKAGNHQRMDSVDSANGTTTPSSDSDESVFRLDPNG